MTEQVFFANGRKFLEFEPALMHFTNCRGFCGAQVPEEVRRTQELYAAEIEALVKQKESGKAGKKHPSPSKLAEKLDATGRKFSKGNSVSY